MKTTIDIPEPLLESARQVAANEGTTLKALVESGLREVLRSRERDESFKLRKVSFGGKGLQAGAGELSWEEIRELAYGEGRE